MTLNKYNVYIDESSIDNPKNYFMVIWWIFMKRELRNELKYKIKEIRTKHKFFSEIKWSKFNKKNLTFMKEIIDLFFLYDGIQFHCIVVDKREVDYEKFHNWDKELAFYKFIFTFLKYKFKNNSIYYLFLDNKENIAPKRIKILWNILSNNLYFTNDFTTIKHIQSYNSKDVQFIQLADFFSWMIWYTKNWFDTSFAKKEISKYLASKLCKTDLDFKSKKEDIKFNIFQIKW